MRGRVQPDELPDPGVFGKRRWPDWLGHPPGFCPGSPETHRFSGPFRAHEASRRCFPGSGLAGEDSELSGWSEPVLLMPPAGGGGHAAPPGSPLCTGQGTRSLSSSTGCTGSTPRARSPSPSRPDASNAARRAAHCNPIPDTDSAAFLRPSQSVPLRGLFSQEVTHYEPLMGNRATLDGKPRF